MKLIILILSIYIIILLLLKKRIQNNNRTNQIVKKIRTMIKKIQMSNLKMPITPKKILNNSLIKKKE